MQFGGRLAPAQFWARQAEGDELVRDSAATLPCFGLVGWVGPRMVGDWQWDDRRLATVGLAHGAPQGSGPRLHVSTTVHDPVDDVRSLRIAAAGPFDDGDALQRRVDEFAAAVVERASIVVDAAPTDIAVWRDGDRWWAAGRHLGYGLVLEARDIPVGEVELARVLDIEPYITGRRAWLRTLRGEH